MMDPEQQLMRRKFFVRWRIYATTKLRRQRAIRKAVYSYNVRLKQKALNSLLKNCLEAKRSRSFYASLSTASNECPEFQAAGDLRRKIILKRAFNAWSSYSRRRCKKKRLNHKITKLRNELSLSRYIQSWKFICLEKKRNSELEEKAIAFHRNVLLRKSLRLWIEDRNHRLVEKNKWQDAIMHYRRNLLNKIWHGWIKYCNNKIEKANKCAETSKFYERKLLRKCFGALVTNVSQSIAERALHETALNFHASKLLRRFTLVWINYHRRRVELERKIEIHRKKRENTLKQKTLCRWRLYVWKKKCSRRREKNSTSHYKKKLAAKAITVMKNYVLYRKQKIASLLYLEHGIAQISLTVQGIYVAKWRTAVIRFAQERQKFSRAEEHWSARTTKRYFFVWKIFSERYKIRAIRKRKLSEIGKCVLLNKYLNRWHTKYAPIAIINEKLTHAATIYSTKIKSRIFKSWKRYVDERKTKRKMDLNDSMTFHRRLVLRDCTNETSKSRIDSSKTLKKRSVEDFQIVRKMFNRWSTFLHCNEDRKFRDIASRNLDRRAYEIPYSTRLILPEYMRKKMMGSRDNCRFNEGNTQVDNFEFDKFSRRYLLREGNRSQSDRSTSDSDASNNSSLATYSILSPV